MTPEEIQALPALADNDTSNEGEDNEDNETGPGGNSAKTPVSLLQVWSPFLDFPNISSIFLDQYLYLCDFQFLDQTY